MIYSDQILHTNAFLFYLFIQYLKRCTLLAEIAILPSGPLYNKTINIILSDYSACQHYLTTCMCNSLFDGRGFAENHFSRLSVSENANNA